MQKKRDLPIGIFDSGIGGLTIVKSIIEIFPNEKLIYLGDTARLPYGSKTESVVKKYSLENSKFLINKKIKAIVIACNTASAISMDYLKDKIDIPIIGVVNSGALAAVNATKNKKIGVIGTKGTIKSRAYSNIIKKIDNEIEVFELPTPLLVPIVEENWINKKITLDILHEYLDVLSNILKPHGVLVVNFHKNQGRKWADKYFTQRGFKIFVPSSFKSFECHGPYVAYIKSK